MRGIPKLWRSQSAGLLGGDCACPVLLTRQAQSRRTVEVHDGRWVKSTEIFEQRLSDEHYVLFDLAGDGTVVVANQPALQLYNRFSFPCSIHLPSITDRQGIDLPHWRALSYELAVLGILQPFDPPSPMQNTHHPSTLTAWLHLTNQCNLRCSYCYLEKTKESMSPAVGHSAVEAVFRVAQQHSVDSIALKYAGGEALLNFRLIGELHNLGARLAQHNNLLLSETILTNGVALTEGMLTTVRDANIALSISLDGIGETHDAQRKFANGRGSFTHVARAIDRAIAAGVKPFLSITVTGRNAAALPQVVAFAIDRGLRFNLNFFRDNDCSSGITDLRGETELIIAGMRAAFAVIEDHMPAYRVIDNLVDRSAFHAPHGHACGAGHSYMVIDHHGAVARCQMEIERPVTSVYAADPLTEIRLYADGFQNLPAAEKEGCRDCTWRNWCAGGCSLLTYRMTGRNDVKSPYCSVYKALFPEMLRLEGLRLLKWGSDIPN